MKCNNYFFDTGLFLWFDNSQLSQVWGGTNNYICAKDKYKLDLHTNTESICLIKKFTTIILFQAVFWFTRQILGAPCIVQQM